MNGVRLTLSGRLFGHRKRETTAINAHLNDGAYRDAAAQAAAVTARTMGHRVESSPLPDEAEHSDTLLAVPEFVGPAKDAGLSHSDWYDSGARRAKRGFSGAREGISMRLLLRLGSIPARIAGITP